MHSKHFLMFGAAICVAAMLAYLFVFAEADVAGVEAQNPPAAAAQ